MDNGMTYKEIAEWLEGYKHSDADYFYASDEQSWKYKGQDYLIDKLLDDLQTYENTL